MSTQTEEDVKSARTSNWVIGIICAVLIGLIVFCTSVFIVRHHESERIEYTYGVTILHGIRDDGIRDGKFKVVGWGDTKECAVPRTEAEWSNPLSCAVTATSTHESQIEPINKDSK